MYIDSSWSTHALTTALVCPPYLWELPLCLRYAGLLLHRLVVPASADVQHGCTISVWDWDVNHLIIPPPLVPSSMFRVVFFKFVDDICKFFTLKCNDVKLPLFRSVLSTSFFFRLNVLHTYIL